MEHVAVAEVHSETLGQRRVGALSGVGVLYIEPALLVRGWAVHSKNQTFRHDELKNPNLYKIYMKKVFLETIKTKMKKIC